MKKRKKNSEILINFYTTCSSRFYTMMAPYRLSRSDLMSSIIFSIIFFASIVAGQSIIPTPDAGFQREECLKKLALILQRNDTAIKLDPNFFKDPNPANPILTLYGCEQLCGSRIGWHSDSISRLVTWLLPIILLISNMQFQPIGNSKLWLIPHLLADPIDSTSSLLVGVHRWSQFFTAQTLKKEDIMNKSITVILAAAHEVSYPLNSSILEQSARTNRSLILETARTLVEARNNELRRTLFALAFYLFQVLAAFVPAIGAAASPSGGRVAMAMLLSWLVPLVLLSNAVGDFGPLWNCQKTLARFVERLEQPAESRTTTSSSVKRFTTQTPALTPWTGSIYSMQPKKRFFDSSGYKLFSISVLPVAVASAAAFAILDTGPTYFSCAHIFVIGVFFVWVCSAIFTSCLSWSTFGSAKSRWYWILVKDTIVATLVLSLIIASSCGLWKTCYCWTGALVHGASKAECPLNPTAVFDKNNHVIYPAMVATALCFQVCTFAAMVWIAWPGFRAMSWSADEKNMADINHNTD